MEDFQEIQKDIAAIVRRLRAENDYTQEYVATKIGMSQNAYSKLERAKTTFDMDHIYRLAHFYNLTPTSFLPDPKTSTGINTTGLVPTQLSQFLAKARDAFRAALKKDDKKPDGDAVS